MKLDLPITLAYLDERVLWQNTCHVSDFKGASPHLCHRRQVAHGALTLAAGLATWGRAAKAN